MMWKDKKSSIKLDANTVGSTLFNVAANFITNLCGQGDAWLRRFCLDHAHLLVDKKFYDFEKIIKIAYKVTGIEQIMKKSFFEKNVDILRYASKHAEENISFFSKHDVLESFKTGGSDKPKKEPKSYNLFGTKPKYSVTMIDSNYFLYSSDQITLIFCEKTPFVCEPLLKYFLNSKTEIKRVIGTKGYRDDEFEIYCFDTNLGLSFDGKNLSVFSIKAYLTDGESWSRYRYPKQVSFDGHFATVGENSLKEFNIINSRKCKSVFYHSDGCTDNGGEYIDEKYLSSYGSSPIYIQSVLSIISRKILGLSSSDSVHSGDSNGRGYSS